jgi:hypothetical protein
MNSGTYPLISTQFGTGDIRWKLFGKFKIHYVISAFRDILGGKLKGFQYIGKHYNYHFQRFQNPLSVVDEVEVEPKSGMLSTRRLQYLLISHCQIYVSTSETPQRKFTLKTVTIMFAEILKNLQHYMWYVPKTWSNTLYNHSLNHGAEPSLRSRQLCSYSKTSQHLMEPEDSLPCSQEPSTGPNPQPDQSKQYHPIPSKIHFNIIHPPTSSS